MEPVVAVDCEMQSQPETEDTDGGEVNAASSSSDLNTTTDDSACAVNSAEPEESTERMHKNYTVAKSVDLTDVTELSNLEDFSAVDRKNSLPDKLEDIEREIPEFDFSGNWYYQKCFQGYWTHYKYAMAWCHKHYKTYHELHQKYYGDIPGTASNKTGASLSSWPHPYTSMPKPDTCHDKLSNAGSISSNSRNKRRHRRRRLRRQSQSSLSQKSNDTSTQTSELEEFEMEITPEMMEFFMKSQKHKEERDELKMAQDNTEEERERINVEEVRTSHERVPTIAPPKRRPGSKRTEEMKLLYGKGAPMIHGMETALQMTFDRNLDIKQPKMWPNMPLKILFA